MNLTDGHTTDGTRAVLRLEGLALLAVALIFYARDGGDWARFAVLFLVPDLSLIAYAFGPRLGALAYNAAHSTIGALALLAAGQIAAQPAASALAFIWLAHIGFDRALGYGLKSARGFRDTHLGYIGRTARNQRS
jgi:hypothetical protein